MFEHRNVCGFVLCCMVDIGVCFELCQLCEFDDFSGTQLFFSFFVTALNFSFASFLLFQDKRKRRSRGEPLCVFESGISFLFLA